MHLRATLSALKDLFRFLFLSLHVDGDGTPPGKGRLSPPFALLLSLFFLSSVEHDHHVTLEKNPQTI